MKHVDIKVDWFFCLLVIAFLMGWLTYFTNLGFYFLYDMKQELYKCKMERPTQLSSQETALEKKMFELDFIPQGVGTNLIVDRSK